MAKISPLNEVAVEAEEHTGRRAFLGEIKLEKHVAAMVQAGYDDGDFLKDLDADSLERLRVAQVELLLDVVNVLPHRAHIPRAVSEADRDHRHLVDNS